MFRPYSEFGMHLLTHINLFHYTCSHFITHALISLHMHLFHYACNYFITHALTSLHMHLFHYTCIYFITHAIISLHMLLLHFTSINFITYALLFISHAYTYFYYTCIHLLLLIKHALIFVTNKLISLHV